MKNKIVITLFVLICILLSNLIITNRLVYATTSAEDSNGLQWSYQVVDNEAQNVYLLNGNYGKKLIIPDSLDNYPVTSIAKDGYDILKDNGNKRSLITEVQLPSSLKKINNDAFSNFTSLKNIEIPSSVVHIGNKAFYNCTKISNINFSDNLSHIGDNAFANTGLSGELVLPSNLSYIGNYAFSNCKNLTGNLNIPNSVKTLGDHAFFNCYGLNGILNVGNGVKSILGETFSGTKFSRVNLGEITDIGYSAFLNYKDIYINNEESKVTLNSSGVSGLNKYPTIHWKNHTHKIDIIAQKGIKLINVENNEEIKSGEYACESLLRFKLQIAPEYKYPDLKIIIVDENDSSNTKTYFGNEVKEYKIDSIISNKKIYIQNISDEPDLALRMFITEVNSSLVSKSRVPVFKIINGEFSYLHTKNPVSVKKGDLVKYKIRVYNEALVASQTKKIAVHIPEGLEFESTNRTNSSYGWTLENGLVVTSYLDGQEILANSGNGVAKYKDIEIVLKVTLDKNSNDDAFRTVFAEIYESDKDYDSTPANIKITSTDNYRIEELQSSDSNSYLKCGEDDEDFDTVFLRGKVKVDYNIVVDKIDSESKELLKGAKFTLFDENGNEITTVESDKDGRIDFGGLSTYGNGTDIYYIQEVKSPEGYYLTDNKKIKVRIEKTILDEDKGLYSLKVYCDTQDYSIDTTRYEFTPVYTEKQLRKIGSGEIVEIDGVKYEYNIDTNYKLMKDIQITSNWEPIAHEMKCIIDGDGHKISGLVIEGDKMASSEIGLFSVFSGVIKNLELENVKISFEDYQKDAQNISGKTGVGAFAGVMREGYLINCKASGNISTAVDNIGGFVGHTLEKGIVRVDGCTNNINILGRAKSNNVGGIIGCALGSVSINNAENNGELSNGRTNVGGLVGYVKPSEYQDLSINTAFDEDNKIVNLLVENMTTSSDYSVLLKEIDIDTQETLLGGKYTVYDGGKNVIDGLEKLELDEIMKKILDRELRGVGLDTYYIIEEEAVKGYISLTGVVCLNIERYWDEETNCYKIRISTSVLTEDQYEKAEPNMRKIFDRGDIFTDVKIEKANFNSEKAEFINCVNNGIVKDAYMNGAGIVATSHGYTYIENCRNTANIKVPQYGKAGGIISELYAFKKKVEIKDCENTGKIESSSSTCPGAGIAGNVVADLKISNCRNSGEVITIGSGAAAGILADARGIIHVDECENTGHIQAYSNTSSSYANVDSLAAGIFAFNSSRFNGYWVSTSSKEDNVVYITNCNNYGSLDSNCHVGGMLAYSDAVHLEIKNCSMQNSYIHDIAAADKGAIVGYANVPSIEISNCIVDNVDLKRTSSIVGNTYGATGGIMGNWSSHGWMSSELQNLVISNCTVTNSNMETLGQNTGGILGLVDGSSSKGTLQIKDCYVGKSTVLNNCTSGTYGGSGGILGNGFGINVVQVQNSVTENTSVESNFGNRNGGDIDVGGIVGIAGNGNILVVTGCDVKHSNVNLVGNRNDGTDVTGGVVGYAGYSLKSCTISDCNVLDTDVTTNAGTMGGIVGDIHTSYNYNASSASAQITNCSYKNGTITNTGVNTTCTITSGVVGYTSDWVLFANIEVDDAKIYSKMENPAGGSNTTGVLGMTNGKTEFYNCNVTNSIISGNGAYGSPGSSHLSCISGILGTGGNNAKFENCNVINNRFLGEKAANVAGIVGSLYNGCTDISNCIVKDSTMESYTTTLDSSGNTSVGGMVGVSNFAIIKNSNIENCHIKSKGSVTGGIIATVVNSNKSTIDNVVVKDVDIIDTGTNQSKYGFFDRSVGGVISSVASNGHIEISNITIENLDINSKATTVGGVVGWAFNIDKFENVDITKLSISNDPMTNYSTTSSILPKNYYGSTAGVIGDVESLNAEKIVNVNVTDAEISAKCHNVSGFIGSSDSETTIEDVNINDITVTNTNETKTGYLGQVAGIMSYTDSKLNVKNTSLNGVELKINSGASNYGYHMGGILAYGYDGNFDNINLTDVNVTNNVGGIAGGVVGMSVVNKESLGNVIEYPITITNSNIDNVNIKGNSHCGAIAGLSNKMTIVNTNAEDVIITGNDVSGILLGLPYSESENTITVMDSNIKNSSVNSNNKAGGVVGYAGSSIEVDGLTLDKVIVEAEYEAGGIAGNNGSSFKANNVSIINKSKISGNNLASGLIGHTHNVDLDNVIVDNAIITSANQGGAGIISIAEGNVNSNNVKVVNNTEISGNGYTAGILGYLTGKAFIKNPEISNVKITSKNSSAGGIVGVITGDLEVPHAVVKNVQVTAKNHSAGIAGSVNNTVSTNGSTVNNVTLISNSASDLSAGYIGTTSKLTISDSSLEDARINGNFHLGGIMAVGTIDAKDISLNNIEITMPQRNTSVGVGGLIGIANNNSNINGINATDIKLHANGILTGGIAGIAHCSLNDIHIKDSNIKQNTYANVGGIVGIIDSGSLTNSSVENCEVSGVRSTSLYGDIGGAVGSGTEDIYALNNVTVTGTTVTSDKEAGGIVGVTNANITNCKVDNCTISSTALKSSTGWIGGDVGGIVGASSKQVKDCTVTNSTISSNKLAGGIVGAGSSGYTTLENLIVENNTINHGSEEDGSGEYIGAPNIYNNTIKEEEGLEAENFEFLEQPKETVLENKEDILDTDEVQNSEPNKEVEETEPKENVQEFEPEDENIENESKEEIEETESKEEVQETEPKEELQTPEKNEDGEKTNNVDEDKNKEENIEPEVPDMIEPNENDENEQQDEEEKIQENQEPNLESDTQTEIDPENNLEASEDLQMPIENTKQNLQQEKETSGEQ